jgi:hypothetical protein
MIYEREEIVDFNNALATWHAGSSEDDEPGDGAGDGAARARPDFFYSFRLKTQPDGPEGECLR